MPLRDASMAGVRAASVGAGAGLAGLGRLLLEAPVLAMSAVVALPRAVAAAAPLSNTPRPRVPTAVPVQLDIEQLVDEYRRSGRELVPVAQRLAAASPVHKKAKQGGKADGGGAAAGAAAAVAAGTVKEEVKEEPEAPVAAAGVKTEEGEEEAGGGGGAAGKKHRSTEEAAAAGGAAPTEAHRTQGSFALRPAAPAVDVPVTPGTTGAKTPGGGDASTAKVGGGDSHGAGQGGAASAPLWLLLCTAPCCVGAASPETSAAPACAGPGVAWHNMPAATPRPVTRTRAVSTSHLACPRRFLQPPRPSRRATTSSATSLSRSGTSRRRPSSLSWQTLGAPLVPHALLCCRSAAAPNFSTCAPCRLPISPEQPRRLPRGGCA